MLTRMISIARDYNRLAILCHDAVMARHYRQCRDQSIKNARILKATKETRPCP